METALFSEKIQESSLLKWLTASPKIQGKYPTQTLSTFHALGEVYKTLGFKKESNIWKLDFMVHLPIRSETTNIIITDQKQWLFKQDFQDPQLWNSR